MCDGVSFILDGVGPNVLAGWQNTTWTLLPSRIDTKCERLSVCVSVAHQTEIPSADLIRG